MLDSGVIRRIGAVPNHYAIGYTANGMSVWDVEDDHVDAARRGGRLRSTSSRTATGGRGILPEWPYNLFAMVHGRDRAEVDRPRGNGSRRCSARLPRPRRALSARAY